MTIRAIPSREQVLMAASECPQVKDILRILFPEDFKPEPIKDIYEHFAVIRGGIFVSPQVQERLNCGLWRAKCGTKGPSEILNHPMFDGWYGYYVNGDRLKELISKIIDLERS